MYMNLFLTWKDCWSPWGRCEGEGIGSGVTSPAVVGECIGKGWFGWKGECTKELQREQSQVKVEMAEMERYG